MRSAAGERLAGLDLLRGATVAAMLLVNNPGSWSAVWAPLRHAEWHGWTPTDLIFPFFLFIVGITTGLAKKRPKQILRRGMMIVFAGLLLNAFPFYWWGSIPGNADPTLAERIMWRFEHLRYAGVLQRIGVVYLIVAFLALRLSRRWLLVMTAAILVGYWALLTRGPLEPPQATLAAQIDRAVIGEAHLWSSTKSWDPEGPLSTIPAVATAVFGVLAVPLVRARKLRELLLWGTAGTALGLLWDLRFPINKNLWTSSYVLLTAGLAAVCLAAALLLADRSQRASSAGRVLFEPFGLNPLVAFLGSGVMARLLTIVKIDGTSLQKLSYETLFRPWLPPQLASFLWALLFVAIWWVLLRVMQRRGIVLKV